MVQARFRIELRSDLCVGSGQGHTHTIDQDACYDQEGYPYIPARRLKGCLLEAASYIGVSEADRVRLFGLPGKDFDDGESIWIADGKLDSSEKFTHKGYKTPEQVCSHFTYTRAFTAMEGDHVKDGSLWFVRVVKQYGISDSPMVFYAECHLHRQEDFSIMEEIVLALRNIGLMRTRGFGAVRCSLEKAENRNSFIKINTDAFSSEERIFVHYSVQLLDTLMISGRSNDESVDYIPGTSVMGCMARLYMQKFPDSTPESFQHVFLSDSVHFSNLYLTNAEGAPSVPVPKFFGKIKQTGQVVNIYTDKLAEPAKPLKQGYYVDNRHYYSAAIENIYHHSKNKKEILYTQWCLSAGQYFSGSIVCRKQDWVWLEQLFEMDDLRFGRSKTAQYSRCRLSNISIEKSVVKTITIKKEKIFAVCLVSDVVLPDQNGYASLELPILKEALQKALKLKSDTFILQDSFLSYGTTTGYHAKWNLRKPAMVSFAKGSTLLYCAAQDLVLPERCAVGIKQSEGFGEILIYDPEAVKIAKKQKPVGTTIKQIDIYEEAYRDFHSKWKRFFTEGRLNAAFTGRILLMEEQSENMDAFTEKVSDIAEVLKEKKNLVTQIIAYYQENPKAKETIKTIFILGKYKLKETSTEPKGGVN